MEQKKKLGFFFGAGAELGYGFYLRAEDLH
jgi:hypothetical protein